MGLLDRLGIDLDKTDARKLEDGMKGNGLPAIGLHHAVLDGVREMDATTNTQGGFELRFKIIGGPSAGSEVKEALWITEKEKAKNRVLMFMHRLGLLSKVAKNGQEHYVPVPGKSELHQCIGVEVVIDVGEHETREHNGKKYTDARLSFEGVLRLDDKRCEKVPRGAAGAAGAAGGATTPSTQAGTTAAAPAARQPVQQTFEDI
jgi:hypothetical protein